MARQIALTDENVLFLRQHAKERSVKEWALFFNVSVPTIMNAKNKKGVYNFELTENLEGRVY